jgi:hypothetical protein
MFHLDVLKVNMVLHMLQWLYTYVSSIFRHMLQMFYLDVSKVDHVLQDAVHLLLLVHRRGSHAGTSTTRIHKRGKWAQVAVTACGGMGCGFACIHKRDRWAQVVVPLCGRGMGVGASVVRGAQDGNKPRFQTLVLIGNGTESVGCDVGIGVRELRLDAGLGPDIRVLALPFAESPFDFLKYCYDLIYLLKLQKSNVSSSLDHF